MRIITALFIGLTLAPVVLAQTNPTREVQARYAECNALEKRGKPLEFERVLQGTEITAWRKPLANSTGTSASMRVHLASNRVRLYGSRKRLHQVIGFL